MDTHTPTLKIFKSKQVLIYTKNIYNSPMSCTGCQDQPLEYTFFESKIFIQSIDTHRETNFHFSIVVRLSNALLVVLVTVC